MVFRARSTRKVLRAEMLPKSTNSVTYLSGKLRCVCGGVRSGAEIKCLWAQNEQSQRILVMGIITRNGAAGHITSKFPLIAQELRRTVLSLLLGSGEQGQPRSPTGCVAELGCLLRYEEGMRTSGQGPGNVLVGVAQPVQAMAHATTLRQSPLWGSPLWLLPPQP